MDAEDFTVRPLRVFLSYSSEDKRIAGEIKSYLKSLGFDVFLAHEDIEPSVEWQEKIIQNLKDCDVFLPIISENFQRSKWTDQETGFALALNKLIIPISLGTLPYGFIGRLQALKLENDIHDACRKIIKTIEKNPDCKKIICDQLIKSFIKSGNYNQANNLAERLSKYEPFKDKQIKMIVKGYLSNDQIRGGYKSKRKVIEWVNKYKNVLPRFLIEQFEIFTIKPQKDILIAIENLLSEYLANREEVSLDEIKNHFDIPFTYIRNVLFCMGRKRKLHFKTKIENGKHQEIVSLISDKHE